MGRHMRFACLVVLLLLPHAGCKDASEPDSTSAGVDRSQIPDNTIWHLEHSGHLIKIGEKVLIFDYADAERPVDSNDGLQRGLVNPEQLRGDAVYVFVSHAHGDHFNPVIYSWRRKVDRIKYILSDDIRNHPKDVIMIRPGRIINVDGIKVKAYPSSDQGVAFSVYVAGKHVYFAGDNAFWNWRKEMVDEDYVFGDLSFIDRSVPIDIAFQVCDPRLRGAGAGGIYIFAREFEPKLLVPIHMWGEYDFCEEVQVRLRQQGFKGRFWPIAHRGDHISF